MKINNSINNCGDKEVLKSALINTGSNIAEKLSKLQKHINKDYQANDWGSLGSLNHVDCQLKEIMDFLGVK